MNELLKNCPVCEGELMVRTLACRACRTEVTGEFDMPLNRLDLEPEIMDFLKVFIFTEGNIRQSEKLLNCSYPKIKNLLKKTKSALGMQESQADEPEGIIDLLDRGDIDVDEALRRLKRKNH